MGQWFTLFVGLLGGHCPSGSTFRIGKDRPITELKPLFIRDDKGSMAPQHRERVLSSCSSDGCAGPKFWLGAPMVGPFPSRMYPNVLNRIGEVVSHHTVIGEAEVLTIGCEDDMVQYPNIQELPCLLDFAGQLFICPAWVQGTTGMVMG